MVCGFRIQSSMFGSASRHGRRGSCSGRCWRGRLTVTPDPCEAPLKRSGKGSPLLGEGRSILIALIAVGGRVACNREQRMPAPARRDSTMRSALWPLADCVPVWAIISREIRPSL